MLIEAALMTYILAQSTITSYVTGSDGRKRIDFMIAKQETAKPYIVISKIDAPGKHTQDGPVAVVDARFQISIFSTTYGQAHQIAAAVKSVLDGYQGLMGEVYIFSCLYDDEQDLYEENTKLFHVPQDYIISYQET
jgi:hypothetical protein